MKILNKSILPMKDSLIIIRARDRDRHFIRLTTIQDQDPIIHFIHLITTIRDLTIRGNTDMDMDMAEGPKLV